MTRTGQKQGSLFPLHSGKSCCKKRAQERSFRPIKIQRIVSRYTPWSWEHNTKSADGMGTSLNHYLLDTNIHIFCFAGVILPSQLRQQNHPG
jgi:hypothetical protein